MESRLRAPTVSQLRIFVATVETGSLTNAASELDISQSAVSHAIGELEDILGVRLLKRGRRGSLATEAGERIAVHARKALQLVDGIVQEAAYEQGKVVGTVRIASFRSAATHLLPSLITAFRREHPGVSFTVQSLEGIHMGVERAVLAGRADVGITSLPVSEELMSWEIAQDDWLALFPEDGMERPDTLTWANLKEYPFIMCNEGGAQLIREYWTKHGAVVEETDRVDDDSVVLSMVAHGLGVSVLPTLAVEPAVPGVKLHRLPEPFVRRIGVVVSPLLFSTPAVSTFIRRLQDPRYLMQCDAVRRGLLRLP
jgi:DNA-binding transcriptional LysR family regulator